MVGIPTVVVPSPDDPNHLITFDEVLEIILQANFQDEMDEDLARAWRDLYFDKNLEYFKIALPYIWPLRFQRRLLKSIMKHHKFGGGAMAKLKQGGYKIAKKGVTLFDRYKK